jgi:hypothetical protein
MKKQAKRLLMLGVSVLASGVAVAGLVNSVPVAVTLNADGSGNALGNMTTARFSADAVQYIGCSARRYDDGAGGATGFGFCQAGSADGVEGFCSTDNIEVLEAIQSISSYSYISFAWNADGVCRTISNSTQSFYIP